MQPVRLMGSFGTPKSHVQTNRNMGAIWAIGYSITPLRQWVLLYPMRLGHGVLCFLKSGFNTLCHAAISISKTKHIVNSSWANANPSASKATESFLVAALRTADGLCGNSLASNEGFATTSGPRSTARSQLDQLGWLQNHPLMEIMDVYGNIGDG